MWQCIGIFKRERERERAEKKNEKKIKWIDPKSRVLECLKKCQRSLSIYVTWYSLFLILKWNACSFNVSDTIYVKFLMVGICHIPEIWRSLSFKNFKRKFLSWAYKTKTTTKKKCILQKFSYTICYKWKGAAFKTF